MDSYIPSLISFHLPITPSLISVHNIKAVSLIKFQIPFKIFRMSFQSLSPIFLHASQTASQSPINSGINTFNAPNKKSNARLVISDISFQAVSKMYITSSPHLAQNSCKLVNIDVAVVNKKFQTVDTNIHIISHAWTITSLILLEFCSKKYSKPLNKL